MSERWLPVVGYEGFYEVSDEGRVRSLDRVNARGHRLRGRELRPGKHSRGYLVVNLAGPEGIRQHLAHRLVLDAFVGPQPEKHALHWNDVPDDNRRRVEAGMMRRRLATVLAALGYGDWPV